MVIHKSGDALLACVGENTPDRDTFIFWDFNGTSLPLDNNEDFHHQSDFEYFQEQETLKVNFSLLIRNVTERDTGAYHCGVRTLKGNDSDTIYLSLVTPGTCTNDYIAPESMCKSFVAERTNEFYLRIMLPHCVGFKCSRAAQTVSHLAQQRYFHNEKCSETTTRVMLDCA